MASGVCDGAFQKTSDSVQDQRNNSYFMGLDFAF